MPGQDHSDRNTAERAGLAIDDIRCAKGHAGKLAEPARGQVLDLLNRAVAILKRSERQP